MKKVNSLGHGLTWGIPTLGRPVPLDFALAFKAMNPPINFSVNYAVVQGKQVADARNIIAKQSVANGSKYLFFLGDDVVPPAQTLRQLIYRMEQNENIGVVGAVYSSKCDPSAPLVFKGDGGGSYWDWKIGEFFECTGLGMDATLIRVSVLSEMSEPWFKTVDDTQFLDGVNKAEMWTEDLYFCNKMLEETKYKVYCDGSLICPHWDIYSNRPYTMPQDSLPFRVQGVSKESKCLQLGPAPGFYINDAKFHITTCSNDELNTTFQPDYRLTFDNLPFAEDVYDLVVRGPGDGIDLLLGHFTEWLRVLKPGGKFVTYVPYPVSMNALIKTINLKHPELSDGVVTEDTVEFTKYERSNTGSY